MVNLALQGGGAHGAFAWGVLDRLLKDGRIGIDGISATSAGSMNAVMLAHGYVQGGREGACRALDAFWTRVAQGGERVPVRRLGIGGIRALLRVQPDVSRL
jgi:NTE family protein